MSRELPMFPLGMVVFPHQVVGLCVFEPRYHAMLDDVIEDQRFGTCLIARGSEIGGYDERTAVGTLMQIVASQSLPNGQALLMVEGVECFEVTQWLTDSPYPRAQVRERCCDEIRIDPALLRSTESAVKALRALQSEVFADQCLRANCEMDDDPWIRSWQLCSMTPMSTLDQFKVLSLSDPNDRLRLVAEVACERYGDYQRMLAEDGLRSPFD
ncbi:MAG TPA: LON peptidase substrate-binding domain-containing protein [Acidimicrobiales bacterium]|nr:LON peptidase substrate-binding domain-containing protein [Acidimicrobiales bacterium]HUX03660.1 LON peptidase substrate-binding domain-containing protein [Acidimicrobiales bacterium]